MKDIYIKEAIERAWHNEPARANLSKLAQSAVPELQKLFPKFEQIAFYTPNIEASKDVYRYLGCKTWMDDTVTARGRVGQREQKEPNTIINVATLAFNYDLGIELELIKYNAGMNWHRKAGRIEDDGHCSVPFLSHMAYHTEGMADEKKRLLNSGFHIVQDVRTISHTSVPLMESGRRYNYVIFATRDVLGFDVKVIERIEPVKG